MTEVQEVALQIALRERVFYTDNEDALNENILNAYEKAKLFLFLTGDDVQGECE